MSSKSHDIILSLIKKELRKVESNIEVQIDLFYKTPEYKSYNGLRRDKGYKTWKAHVLTRFDNTCCVCLSAENLVAHHLYSYKYYSDLRTNINNGVCLCINCHEKFNELYSNVNTLQQFEEFRRHFKNKKSKKMSRIEVAEYQATVNAPPKKQHEVKPVQFSSHQENVDIKNVKQKNPTKAQTKKQLEVIKKYEDLKLELINERMGLEKKYGRDKSIEIEFRGKKTTSKSAMAKLLKEVTRINTLIRCNRLKDKSTMAAKFYMNLDEFCQTIAEPSQYLRFSDAEITHLNRINSIEYAEEEQAHLDEINNAIKLK